MRDYTKGHPRIEANNHPIRHGRVVGIHNGIILNDEELFARYGFERAEPEMTVDSEAIFALAEHAEGHPEALEELDGAMATAWFDERVSLHPLPRPRASGVRSGSAPAAASSSSRRPATRSRCSRARCGSTLRKRELDEGTLLRVEDGHVVATERFQPDHSYVEETIAPRRAGAARGPQLPAAPRRHRLGDRLARLSAARRPAPRRLPRRAARSRTRNWNAAQAPRCTSIIR